MVMRMLRNEGLHEFLLCSTQLELMVCCMQHKRSKIWVNDELLSILMQSTVLPWIIPSFLELADKPDLANGSSM